MRVDGLPQGSPSGVINQKQMDLPFSLVFLRQLFTWIGVLTSPQKALALFAMAAVCACR
jgi:hypothetical protein